MWWGKGSDKGAGSATNGSAKQDENKAQQNGVAPSKPASTFDPELPPRERLPAKLQSIVDKSDKEDNFFDELTEG
jgi:fission process protein 1